MAWVKPTFVAGEGSSGMEPEEVDRQHKKMKNKRRMSKRRPWVDLYAPKSREHLATHPVEVRDLENYLKLALVGAMGKAPIGIMQGPAGCGKTTTLKMVAKDMNCNVREWVTPSYSKTDGQSSCNSGAGSPSQLDLFESFLFQTSNESPEGKYILLVENFPYVYFRDPSLMEKTLHKYKEVGRAPLVFICLSIYGHLNADTLMFPPHMHAELPLQNIYFNAVEKTMMVKSLERVLSAVRKDNPKLEEEWEALSEEIATIANGNIRFAVNHLQFKLLEKNGELSIRTLMEMYSCIDTEESCSVDSDNDYAEC